jgi:hypothetical protein
MSKLPNQIKSNQHFTKQISELLRERFIHINKSRNCNKFVFDVDFNLIFDLIPPAQYSKTMTG